MTIGIYALYWTEQDLVYIGQSQNIEYRFREHLYKLNKGVHSNYKVQNTYNVYNCPELHILETCSIDKLNQLEIFYTEEFDSINNGLNIVEAGKVGWGSNSAYSKYTRKQILQVFSLLYKTDKPSKVIASRANTSISLVNDIKSGRSHLWLKEAYLEKYLKMLALRASLIKQNQQHSISIQYNVKLIDPNRVVHTVVSSLPEFCRTIPEFTGNIRQHYEGLARVVRKERKSHKGWKLYGN